MQFPVAIDEVEHVERLLAAPACACTCRSASRR
jgi:hypothetical protein